MDQRVYRKLLPLVQEGKTEDVRTEVEGLPAGELLCREGVYLMREALLHGHTAILEMLAGSAGGVHARNPDDLALLDYAVGQYVVVVRRTASGEQTDVQLAEWLMARGADALAAGRDGWTALHGVQDPKAAELLVRGSASVQALWNPGDVKRLPHLQDAAGQVPLHTTGEKAVAEVLLHRGADPNAPDSAGATPVHYRARWGPADTLRLLLKKGGDHRRQDREGNTPLHVAAVRSAHALLDAGADLEVLNHSGSPPMHEALLAWSRSGEAGEALALKALTAFFERNPSLDLRDGRGRTLLMHVVSRVTKPEAVTLLLQRGADVHALDADGETALHAWAREGNNAKLATPLLVAGADVNAPSVSGVTPLHAAVQGGAPFRVSLLIEKGADATRKDASGRMPLDLATADPATSRLVPILKKAMKGRP